MRLIDILRPTFVWHDLAATTKGEVISELGARMASCLGPQRADEIGRVLAEREKLGSTGIQDGIAIPHGKLPGLEEIVVACGRSQAGIDFGAHDEKPTHLFFVLLAPEFAAGGHLKALARLSRILKDARFRERLMAAKDSGEMYAAIAEEDGRI